MTDDIPVRLLKRTVGCANRLFEVYLDQIASPTGETVSDFLVVSPRHKSENLVGGVAILPILDGMVGLLQIYRYPVSEYTWEVPRGFIDDGENALTAALRELEEETGLLCCDQDVIDLGTIFPDPGILAGRTHIFAATKCQKKKHFKPNELGHMALQFFPIKEIAAMTQKAEIEDAQTLAVLYRYHQSLDRYHTEDA